MDLGLKDTVAVVAGASKGLGRAVALGLAREGVKVAICSRDAERIAAAGADIRRETGAEVFAAAVDVTNAFPPCGSGVAGALLPSPPSPSRSLSMA